MTFSSCLTNEDCALALDASVVINLLATGHPTPILTALSVPIVVVDNVVREIERGAMNGRQEIDLLARMIDDRIVLVAELDGEALQIFLNLVSGTASESLGDGEAATLAFALRMGCTAAIDEKKATRLAVDRFESIRLVTTVDILAHDTVRTSIGDALLADATFQALRVARMQVREHQFDWIVRTIGEENIANCSSLKRLATRRSAGLVQRATTSFELK
jgi:predicted nucleic acid-binding protein